MQVGSTVTCVPWFLCSSKSTCGVSCVEHPLLYLCLAASVPRAQTDEAFPRGPLTVVTFLHLFVKVNNTYMGLSLFRHSLHLITFAEKFAGCTLDSV